MSVSHKNKTLATLLAAVGGGLGLHRFYLRGLGDKWGWLHAAALPVTGLVALAASGADPFYKLLPLIISVLVGFLEALVLAFICSILPLALVLVAALMVGAFGLIASIARLFDLLYTGGIYG